MKNIFENAYFGKAYKTRDGRKAIFVEMINNSSFFEKYTKVYSCIHESGQRLFYTQEGNDVTRNCIDKDSLYNIVSEWEEVNEEELDKLAYDEAQLYSVVKSREWQDGFKTGYRKSLKR